jgi:3'-phosphoadenosine 5'-phosphosulfate sulfotransferase (PAPS reductase)/FAD synthetase
MEYYFCDTGKELKETYLLIDELENFLGKPVARWKAAQGSPDDPFDHFLKLYKGYLPSNMARWCTKNLKLEPFEREIGGDLVISYVAIRGDENREGYVSTKPNIQTIFPFRKNIWSIDVLTYALSNIRINEFYTHYSQLADNKSLKRAGELILQETSKKFLFSQKVEALLNINIPVFNKAVFSCLKGTPYPISQLDEYSLLPNKEIIDKQEVIKLIKTNGIKYPQYAEEITYKINGEVGHYSRSRSGCFFCFYQQKIEWVWLFERHRELFNKAMEYEKDGYTWNENESLEELSRPERIKQIKEEHLVKVRNKLLAKKSNKLIDVLDDPQGISCVNCFI